MIYRYAFALLITISVIGMDIPPAPVLVKEIITSQLVPRMTLQEMSRLKRTCKGYSTIDIENLLMQKDCYALYHLFNNCAYDRRTMVLAHYGLVKNNDMFKFLWDKEKELRDDDHIMYSNTMADFPLDYCMKKYAQEYSTRKKIEKIRVKQLSIALSWGGTSLPYLFLKKILPGSGFNIWDLQIFSSKKLVSFLTKKPTKSQRIKKIIEKICNVQDADLLLAVMGGIIEPRALKYIFMFSERLFIKALREKGAFIENVPDKKGRDYHYYVIHHTPPSERISVGTSVGGIR